MWMWLAISKKVVRHRSADLPGQADGNISPALLTQRQHRITGERQRAPPSAPRSPTAPPPLRHRSTRTLNPLADEPPHQASPISIIHTTRVIGSGQPATASGVAIIYVCSVLRACRRHPGRLNTRLRTAATASGVAEMLASGHRLRHRRRISLTRPTGQTSQTAPWRYST